MKLRLGGAWRDLSGGRARVGGAWRSLVAGKSYVGGAWRDVANFTSGAGAIDVTLSTSSVSRSGRLDTITTASVTATPTGGQTPYTYAWAKLSGDTISAVSPSSAVTQFQASGLDEGETRNATFRCTATDAFGSSDTADVTVSITRIEGIDPGGEL